MKIKFEYRGDWMEYSDATIGLEDLKDIRDSVGDYDEFEEYIIDSVDAGHKEFGMGEDDIIKIYEEKEGNVVPERYIKDNGDQSENPEWRRWRDQQGKSGLKVNFEISKFRDFSFLLDLDFLEIMTEEEHIEQESEKEGVAVQVNLHHRGVVRYTSTEINDKKFNPKLFTIKQYKYYGEYRLDFYYNNNLLKVEQEEIESDGEGSEWSIFSRGTIDDDKVWDLVPEEGDVWEEIEEEVTEEEELQKTTDILERIEAERNEIGETDLRVDFTNVEEKGGRYYYQGELFTGTLFDFYDNGNPKREVQTLLGEEHGKVKIWHKNGVQRTENTFDKGRVVEGQLKQWDEDGIEIKGSIW